MKKNPKTVEAGGYNNFGSNGTENSIKPGNKGYPVAAQGKFQEESGKNTENVFDDSDRFSEENMRDIYDYLSSSL